MAKFTRESTLGELIDDQRVFKIIEQEVPDVFYGQVIDLIGSPFLDQIREFTLQDAVVAMPTVFGVSEETANELAEKVLELQ